MAAITAAESQALVTAASCDMCVIPAGMVWQAVLAAILDIQAGGSVPEASVLVTEASCLNCVAPPGMVPYMILAALRSGGISGGGVAGEVGVGSPEGALTAEPGTTYYDTASGGFWVKGTGSGNTGWVQLIA